MPVQPEHPTPGSHDPDGAAASPESVSSPFPDPPGLDLSDTREIPIVVEAATALDTPKTRRPVSGPMPGEDPDEPTRDRLTRRLLGNAALLVAASRGSRFLGWLIAIAVGALGGALRFWRLDVPHALVFDETFYVKDAYSLLTRGYEANWASYGSDAFVAGDPSGLQMDAEYFVHPEVGKWLIAWGMDLGGGPGSVFAWRLAVAIAGTLAVVMVARIAQRLFASIALGGLAGLFMAVDGLGIVMSRTSLLDPFLMVFVLAAFGALLIDRDRARRRLAAKVAALVDQGMEIPPLGPGLGIRWWRLIAAVLLGLAIGVKWSGLYFLAVFGLMSVLWDITARRAVGVRRWLIGALLRDGLFAGFSMVFFAAGTYLATWTGWFRSDEIWGRHWAEENPGEGVMWLPPALRSLWKLHQDWWHFHNTLESPHPYAAHPIGWIVQLRPTSYYYPTEISGLSGDQAISACGADSCSQAVTSLGNPLIWWLAAVSVIVAIFWLFARADWRAGAVLSGLLAGWVPWFFYAHRTIFTFYSIAFLPWVILTLTYVMGLLVGPKDQSHPDERRHTIRVLAVLVVIILAVSAFFYPVWTAWVIPYDQWRWRMWLPSWV